MAGIYIKGMEMPTNCDMCWALDDFGDYPRCRITEEQRGYNFPVREKRMDKCPLIPVPDHRRLISAKRIEFELCESTMPKKYREFCRRVILSENLSPTIIPAEEGET